ncbi:MAG: hypothetical protein WC454_03525 [Phycisphaerae bacterium]|jgi:hypothetical protein
MLPARGKKLLIAIAMTLPAVFTFYYVYKFGLRVPYYDQWEIVPQLEKMYNHTLTLADVWRQHNEHRLFFPKSLMFFLAWLSNWNLFFELCANMVIAAFTFLFLLSILCSTTKTASFWLKMFFSLMVFSMVQWENWSWGWQMQIFLSVLGSVIAIWAANKWRGRAIGLAAVIAGAVLSSYSFNTGLVTWPAVLVVMLLQKEWKRKHIMILLLASAVTILLYYYDYAKCPSHSFLFFFIKHPFLYARYVLTYLGASLGRTYYFAPITAMIILALISRAIINIWRFDKQKLRELAPWLALALYACMAACITGVGRTVNGWPQAFASRYTTISIFLPLSTAVLLWHSIKLNRTTNKKKRLRNLLFTVAIAAIFVILYISSCFAGLKDMKIQSRRVNGAAFCLTHPEAVNDQFLTRLYPDPNVIRPRIKVLSDMGIKFSGH